MHSQLIINGIGSVTKKWTKQRKAEERAASAARNRRYTMTQGRQMYMKEACYLHMTEAYLKASGGGTYPATARQIMYAIRTQVQELTGKRLDDAYFTQQILLDYVRVCGKEDEWDIVYDARGHLQEPHSEHVIGLGTLDVRKYLRDAGEPIISDLKVNYRQVATHGPKHRYGAILFIEKEGFMPLFERAQLAERYDLAIMSTKGVSNTASRTLVEELCSHYQIPLLVLHDFDRAGFMILKTLQRDTRRYSFQHTFETIDLGLRLEDVEDYSLQSEEAYEKMRRSKVQSQLAENGATSKEVAFLVDRRVELNAFTSDQLLEWIEGKLQVHSTGKVVPDEEFLTEVYRRYVAAEYLREQTKEIQGDAREHANSVRVPGDLRAKVAEYLTDAGHLSWDDAVQRIIEDEED